MRERDYTEVEDRIREAILELRRTGSKITKLAICEEAGLHRNTLNKPHYNEFIEKEFVEFQKSQVTSSYEELLMQIEKLQAELSKKNSKIRTLNKEIETEKKKRLDFEEKYRFLLGEYQSRVKPNIIPF